MSVIEGQLFVYATHLTQAQVPDAPWAASRMIRNDWLNLGQGGKSETGNLGSKLGGSDFWMSECPSNSAIAWVNILLFPSLDSWSGQPPTEWAVLCTCVREWTCGETYGRTPSTSCATIPQSKINIPPSFTVHAHLCSFRSCLHSSWQTLQCGLWMWTACRNVSVVVWDVCTTYWGH